MRKKKFLFQKKEFDGWKTLNDTVMGGSSSAFCESSNSGLLLKGNIVEKAGGFVSCRSSIYKPPLNVSDYSSFELNIDGQGRTFKFAVACEDDLLGLTEFIPGGLRWIKSFPTKKFGTTNVQIPFSELKPSVRANKYVSHLNSGHLKLKDCNYYTLSSVMMDYLIMSLNRVQ